MNRHVNRCLLPLFLVTGGFLLACAADPPKAKRPTTPEEFEAAAKAGPKPPWRDPKLLVDERKEAVNGTVVAVSADEIEIRPVGKKETVKYPPHALLASGGVCHYMGDQNSYLLDDIQKGDIVNALVGTVDKEKGDECFCLSIRERPGGVIPPSRKPEDEKPYHKQRQRELDYAAKGEYTPERLQEHEERRKLNAEKGLPPPPPLKPLKLPDAPQKKD